MTATRIKMVRGAAGPPRLSEIDEVYIEGIGYHRREAVFEHLLLHPGSIRVGLEPYPAVFPVAGTDNEKYIRSDESFGETDALLSLPVEESGTGTI